MATGEEKPVMVVGVDESEQSTYALEWTLDRFFAPYAPNFPFKLIIVHAKPNAVSAVGLAGPGTAEVVPYVDADLKHTAVKVIEKAKALCLSKSVHGAMMEVFEGDARNILCEVVDKHHASLLVVGSHGYGAIKRAVLGSVSDYCAHHAHCSVMIVKKPKIKVVQETIDPNAKIEFRPDTEDDPHKRKPDITKAKELLGWEPKVALRQGLPLMVKDFRQRVFGDQKQEETTTSSSSTE